MASPQWIKETEAATMLNVKPRTLRNKVKSGVLNINYSTITGRNFFYNEVDIKKVLTAHSTILK